MIFLINYPELYKFVFTFFFIINLYFANKSSRDGRIESKSEFYREKARKVIKNYFYLDIKKVLIFYYK